MNHRKYTDVFWFRFLEFPYWNHQLVLKPYKKSNQPLWSEIFTEERMLNQISVPLRSVYSRLFAVRRRPKNFTLSPIMLCAPVWVILVRWQRRGQRFPLHQRNGFKNAPGHTRKCPDCASGVASRNRGRGQREGDPGSTRGASVRAMTWGDGGR